MFARLRGYRKVAAVLTAMHCFVAVLGVVSVIVNKHLVDRATANSGLTEGIVIMLVATVLSIVLNLIAQMWIITFQEKCSFGIRDGVYHNILSSQWSDLKKYHSEDVLTRLTSDVEQIVSGTLHILTQGGGTVVGLVLSFALLCYYDWRLMLVILVLVPAGLALTSLVGKKMRRIQQKYQETESSYRVFLQESIKLMPVVKAFQQEQTSRQRLKQLRDERLYYLVKLRRLRVVTGTVVHIVFTLGTMVAFLFGVIQIAENKITFGTLTALLALVGQIQRPALSLGEMIRRGITVRASISRVMEIDALPQEAQQESEKLVGGLHICGKGITFAYEDEEIFRNWDLDIPAGETVAVIGHSGVGKTTLVRLLLGFTQPEQGTLVFRDEAGHTQTLSAATRKYISYVPQGNTLFRGSIRENLKIGNPDATEEMLWEALNTACAKSFVQKLPNKLDTQIGEKGTGLSEGQAQRIAIARALLREAPIVIFDEATSALDSDTERELLFRLRDKPHTCTYIFVTHRKTTKDDCTMCIRLDEKA